jgi:hypothetical protein
MILLSRNEFRKQVFTRDKNFCVICKQNGQDAHHIIERRLFDDGGYYIDNGATLCGICHIKAEETSLSCEDIRKAANITNIILPPHLYRDLIYDKWGNIINSNGTKIRGELFFDESVQKILIDKYKFTQYIKYPRTYHLPWSPGITKDDRVLIDTSCFDNQEVIVTEKMDGENTTLYSNYLHARSIDIDNHPSKDWIKNFHAKIAFNIPKNWRLCGENLYAQHSIRYFNLKSYFLLFSIWNDKNECLSWDETVEWSKLLDLELVPVLYKGIFDIKLIRLQEKLTRFGGLNFQNSEGYVIRLANNFNFGQFRKSVAKYVRSNHIQTSHNWKRKKLELNEISNYL